MLISQDTIIRSARIYSQLAEEDYLRDFSWKREYKQAISSKFLDILWLPFFKFRQNYLSNSGLFRYCKLLPGFKNLWSTIQKGSFAYNNLFLGIRPFHRSSHRTDLADVTTLSLFFGDEFIDGLCAVTGKNETKELFKLHSEIFYLSKKAGGHFPTLQYSFDLEKAFPCSVMNSTDSKYKISYKSFFLLLDHFLTLMNCYLKELPFAISHKAADKIIEVCNTCIESYLHDVHSCPVGDQIEKPAEVIVFHEMKTRYMQEKLLELRCILVEKEELMAAPQTQGWLDVMRVVQVYDDLQDVLEDDGVQDNLVISVAYHHYPEEWQWFRTNKLFLADEEQRAMLLSLKMPLTISYCLNLAKDKISRMDWGQQKIMHYLLFKNWFIAKPKTPAKRAEFFIKEAYNELKTTMGVKTETEIKSYLVDICFHGPDTKKLMRKRLGFTNYYQLRYDLLIVPDRKKSAIFDKLIGRPDY